LEGAHWRDVHTGLSGTNNIDAGIPLLRIASASPRSFVKSFEQRDAPGPKTNSQMLSGSGLHYKLFERTRSAREKEGFRPMTKLCSSAAPTEWAAFVAIDWADQKHYWALTRAASEEVEHGQLDATPEGVEAWAAGLNARFSGRPNRGLSGTEAREHWYICSPSTRIW
jgi:hypothetical protein